MLNFSKYIIAVLLLYMLPALCKGQHLNFGDTGAVWYYQNSGKDENTVKHILVRTGAEEMHTDYAGATDTAFNLLFYYLNKDSVAVGSDTVLVKKTYMQYLDRKYNVWQSIYDFSSGYANTYSPFLSDSINRQIREQGLDSSGMVEINGLCLDISYINNQRFCGRYRIGNTVSGIGSLFYMFKMDTCDKSVYGGPLLWYYNPLFGYFIPGKTPVKSCTTHQVNGIAGQKSTGAFHFFPNPAENSVTIKGPAGAFPAVLRITDITGKEVYHQQILYGPEFQVNTGKWKSGVYLLKLYGGDIEYYSKLIKR